MGKRVRPGWDFFAMGLCPALAGSLFMGLHEPFSIPGADYHNQLLRATDNLYNLYKIE